VYLKYSNTDFVYLKQHTKYFCNLFQIQNTKCCVCRPISNT